MAGISNGVNVQKLVERRFQALDIDAKISAETTRLMDLRDSTLFKVASQLDPQNATAVAMMQEIMQQQVQIAEALLHLQTTAVKADNGIYELFESVAANSLVNLKQSKNLIKEHI